MKKVTLLFLLSLFTLTVNAQFKDSIVVRDSYGNLARKEIHFVLTNNMLSIDCSQQDLNKMDIQHAFSKWRKVDCHGREPYPVSFVADFSCGGMVLRDNRTREYYLQYNTNQSNGLAFAISWKDQPFKVIENLIEIKKATITIRQGSMVTRYKCEVAIDGIVDYENEMLYDSWYTDIIGEQSTHTRITVYFYINNKQVILYL